jgi:hypothetical protein
MKVYDFLLATSLAGDSHKLTSCRIILITDVEEESFNVLR